MWNYYFSISLASRSLANAAVALGTPTSSGAGQAAKTLLFDTAVELLTARAGG